MQSNSLRHIIDFSVLDRLITGRVYPHIYAFSTNTVPQYWKIGDTVRPVDVRLSEWRKHYIDLKQEFSREAVVGDRFFRDYAIHSYLERELGKKRLKREDMPIGLYYSNEFFKDISTRNLEDAFLHIEQDAAEGNNLYQFYSEQHLPEIHHYKRDTEPFILRPNQQEAVDAFIRAVKNGRTNLLMYAVMRFGKSFTAMCCAKVVNARIVVIVSAKADVKEEWKKTVEKTANFEGFVFLDGEELNRDAEIITSKVNSGNQVAIFLTLQDLMGGEIKKKHREVFENLIDLLIVDETHYGARAAEYGKVLQNAGLTKTQIRNELKQKDIESVEDVETEVQKHLRAKITLHLSGTPYRILMSSEFTEDDIVSFCQFTDIIDESEKWIIQNNLKEEPLDEWENPYFGFPQMIRFAFSPNESSLQKIKQLSELGKSASLSSLFRPQSIDKDEQGNHKKFVNETEVLDLLCAIDGTKDDENIFPFLNYDKIKAGMMCRHMVFVLPYRASCDALQELISQNAAKFNNLSDYQIINIAGVDANSQYPDVESIKTKIMRYESEGKKTITLTVNRMLTGNTVEQWDTMLFLKDTASPQEYDQAIFRLQNQYVVTFEDANGKIIKFNKKPQTLLVDFDVDRMFRLQELKSQFYNANKDANGNEKLESRIRRELEISPIICLNKGKLRQVTCANIMDAVREYSQSRSVMDEAADIPVDDKILDNETIIDMIRDLVPIDSKKGITFRPVTGYDDIVTHDDSDPEKPHTPLSDKDSLPNDSEHRDDARDNDDLNELAKKLQTYYLQILFFAFLTESKVRNLADIISAITETDDNRRIACNLGLNVNRLTILRDKCTHFIRSRLDYKIENVNNLIRDTEMEPINRAEVALTQFGRMSDSEIVTPKHIAADMVAILPEIENLAEAKFLDIASKQGEFAYALYNRFVLRNPAVANNIYSLPTSPLCYEFTRKIYKLLGMPVANVIAEFTSYDLIKPNNEEYIKKLKDMNLTAIVGNPPYQQLDGGAGVSAKPIYNRFVNVAKVAKSRAISMIMPAKWYTDGKGLDEFRSTMLSDKRIARLVDYVDSRDCFSNVDIAGGVCYFLLDSKHNDLCEFVSISSGIRKSSIRDLAALDDFVRFVESESIIEKVKQNVHKGFYDSKVSTRKPFGLATNARPMTSGDIVLKHNNGYGAYSSTLIEKGKDMIPLWKVIISRLTAEHAGQTDAHGKKRILSSLSVLKPQEICTETYLVVDAVKTKSEVENVIKYLSTCFVRFLISLLASTQQMNRDKFKYVPLQDFTSNSDIDWTKSVAEIDQQLYAKYELDESEIAFIESKIKPMD